MLIQSQTKLNQIPNTAYSFYDALKLQKNIKYTIYKIYIIPNIKYQISISNTQYTIYTKYTQCTNILQFTQYTQYTYTISNSAPPKTHHRPCFNLFILQHNLLDNQKGRDINENIFLRLDILFFAKTFLCIYNHAYMCIPSINISISNNYRT